jgi:histidine ammonia-lyase
MIFNPNYNLSIEEIFEYFEQNKILQLDTDAKNSISKCFDYLHKKIQNEGEAFYGVNTGFGSLCNHVISQENLCDLQYNLLRSHACGTGEDVPKEIVKLMLLLKIKSLSKGHSGVALQTVQRLLDFYNKNIIPCIYEQGSLGASGDLAPLAHLSLPLIGEGEVWSEGKKVSAQDVLEKNDLSPIFLQAKEGLALINGTQFMSAYGIWCIYELQKLIEKSNFIAGLSLEAFDCRTEPFLPLSHHIRPHLGQVTIAKAIYEIRKASQLAKSPKQQVQDPYSFRCIPQVHGASWDVIMNAAKVFETEINSVTDNPNIFPEEDMILSAGNFHGQTLAMQLDFCAIAASELASISERRIYKLISGERNLPPFLSSNPGLHSGYMIAQYTAASIVSQNKQLCSPASVDSIVSSNGQEDHVSMGANAATKMLKIVSNLRTVLSIELMCAAQAIQYRDYSQTSPQLLTFLEKYKQQVPFRNIDVELHKDIKKSTEFLK